MAPKQPIVEPVVAVSIPPGEDSKRPKNILIGNTVVPIENIRDQIVQGIRSGQATVEQAREMAAKYGIHPDYFDELMDGQDTRPASGGTGPSDSAKPKGRTRRRGGPEAAHEPEPQPEVQEQEQVHLEPEELIDLIPDAVYHVLRKHGLSAPGIGVRLTILASDDPMLQVSAEIIYGDEQALQDFEENGTPIPMASGLTCSETASASDAIIEAIIDARERAEKAEKAKKARAQTRASTRHG